MSETNYVDQLEFNPWPKGFVNKTLTLLKTVIPGVLGYLVALVVLLLDLGKVQVKSNKGILHVVGNGPFSKYMYQRNWSGFAFGYATFFWTKESERLITVLHERVHVKQLFQLGLLFPFLYSYELYKRGYRNNKFEVAARALSRLEAKTIIDKLS